MRPGESITRRWNTWCNPCRAGIWPGVQRSPCSPAGRCSAAVISAPEFDTFVSSAELFSSLIAGRERELPNGCHIAGNGAGPAGDELPMGMQPVLG
jgi:hypothetical protein